MATPVAVQRVPSTIDCEVNRLEAAFARRTVVIAEAKGRRLEGRSQGAKLSNVVRDVALSPHVPSVDEPDARAL